MSAHTELFFLCIAPMVGSPCALLGRLQVGAGCLPDITPGVSERAYSCLRAVSSPCPASTSEGPSACPVFLFVSFTARKPPYWTNVSQVSCVAQGGRAALCYVLVIPLVSCPAGKVHLLPGD